MEHICPKCGKLWTCLARFCKVPKHCNCLDCQHKADQGDLSLTWKKSR